VNDPFYKKLYSIDNLELSWMRLKTAQNIFYKDYYRKIFTSYEISESNNLNNLKERLKSNSYKPYEPLRYYIPKNDGLQRPISFLCLDDLIVYQGLANIIAQRIYLQRKKIEYKYVYSYILNKEKNKFFFRRWQEGYNFFKGQLKIYYSENNKWVAHYDLASYYDTISHERLLKDIFPKGGHERIGNLLVSCFKKWSTPTNIKLNHGIPQGPIASNLFSEVFLFDIDKRFMDEDIKYLRYGDDIRIIGKTRNEIVKGIILLEKLCREKGLVPQAKKYNLIEAKDIKDVIGQSSSDYGKKYKKLNSDIKVYQLLKSSFEDKNNNSPIIKTILKTSDKNKYILSYILNNLNENPEYAHEICIFLENYKLSPYYGKLIYQKAILNPSAYEYVEGKYWELLSKFNLDTSFKNIMVTMAIFRLKNRENISKYSLKYGLYKFICSTDNCLILKWLSKEGSSILQSFVSNNVPIKCIEHKDYIEYLETLLKRSIYDPGLITISTILFQNKLGVLDKINAEILETDTTGVIRNTIGKSMNIDGIGEILKRRYDVSLFTKWNILFGENYQEANMNLYRSENSYYIDRNAWIGYIDSFNDILLRSFINLLTQKNKIIKWPKIINNNGDKIDYGVLFDINNNFSKYYPHIRNGLHKIHERRSGTPLSHFYNYKKNIKSIPVTRKEQNKAVKILKRTYELLINELKILLP